MCDICHADKIEASIYFISSPVYAYLPFTVPFICQGRGKRKGFKYCACFEKRGTKIGFKYDSLNRLRLGNAVKYDPCLRKEEKAKERIKKEQMPEIRILLRKVDQGGTAMYVQ